jgi:hypothetical protein
MNSFGVGWLTAMSDCIGHWHNRVGQVHAEGLLGIPAACDADQALNKVRVDTPIAGRIGVGQVLVETREALDLVLSVFTSRPRK